MKSKISHWVGVFFCLLLVTLAVSLSWLRWGINQHSSYHQWVEKEVSMAIGQAVQLDAFQVKLVGTHLQLNLNDIKTEKSGSLKSLALGFDLLASLKADELRLSHVKLVGLTLNLGQQPDGAWSPHAGSKSRSPNLPAWVLALATRVPQLVLQEASLILRPNSGEPITLPKLQAQIQVAANMPNGLTRISVSLQTSKDLEDQAYAFKSQVTLELKANRFEELTTNKNSAITPFNAIQRAQIYLSSQAIEIAPLLSSWGPDNLLVQLDKLRLGGEYWLDYKVDKRLQLVTQNAQLAINTDSNTLDISADLSLTAGLNVQETSSVQIADWTLFAQGLSGQINGVALPLSDLQLSQTNDVLVAQSPKLNLARTRAILNSIKSIPSKIHLPIHSLAPSGGLHQAKLRLNVQQPLEFLLTGEMKKVSVKAWVGVPKITSADGKIWLNRYGGKVIIDDTDGLGLQVAKLTSTPWQVNGLRGEFNWHYGSSVNRFSSSNVRVDLHQGHINFKMMAALPRKDSASEPFIQLALGVQNIDLTSLPKLLPDLVLGKKVGAWLATAAPAGSITEAALIYNGRLGKIESAAGPMARSMALSAHMAAPAFTYHRDWPKVQGFEALLTADLERVSVEAKAGSLNHGKLTQLIKGWRADLPIYQKNEPKNQYIQVYGQIDSDASQLLRAAQTLPLGLDSPAWLTALEPQGQVSLKGSLAIPFGHPSKVTYDLSLSSNNLSGYWMPLKADLRHVELQVELDSAVSGIGAIAGSGLLDGQLVSFKRLSKLDLAQPWLSQIPKGILDDAKANLSAIQDGVTLQFEGRLAPNYLVTKLSQPWLHEIPGTLPFVARWSSCTQAETGCRSISAEVDLSRAAIDLPEPLHSLQQLQLLGYWQDNQQNWYASLDDHQVAVKLAAEKTSGDVMVVGTNVGFNGAVDWAQQGQWTLGGQLNFIDVGPWWEAYQNRSQTWWGVGDQEMTPLLLPEVDVKIKRITWLGLDIDQATLTLEQLKGEEKLSGTQPWRLGISSPQLAGKIDYFGSDHPLVVHIKHAHLYFPEVISSAEKDHDLMENIDLLEHVDPSQFPDADVSIDELLKNGESFGQWQFKTRRQEAQVNVHDFDAYVRSSRLQGNLIWDKIDGIHHTQFTGRVVSTDMASLLMDWGYDPAIVAETAALEVQLKWPRSPLAFAVKEISGDLGLRLKKGSFSDTPSATQGLKILALLDMNRLMKRVKLDFSDIIQPGFSFDSINAHYHFDQGLAATVSPLTLKSTALNLSMDGWIDFNDRQVDNNLILTLPVVDKLPLAALIAGLPQLSGVIYVVNKLIGDELETFTSARYSVVGSLDNPEVKLVRMFDKDYQNQSVQERIENVLPQ